MNKFDAFANSRARYEGMSDYQHAFSWARHASYLSGEISFGNSPGAAAVKIARLASLIALAAKRVKAEWQPEVRALAAKYLAVARRARVRAMAKDPRGYAAALYCHKNGLGYYWPADAKGN